MTLKEKVEAALQKVRPSLQADGGDGQSKADGRLRWVPHVPDDPENGY